MTNKSISEQICEVCGIKPYYGIYVNFGDLDNNYKLVTNKRKYRLIADCRYIVDNEDELKNLEPKYLPDFENALCKLTINLLKKKALNKSKVKRILEDDTNL